MERLKASADCWLSLAAAPTFAIMAFVTAAFQRWAAGHVLCGAVLRRDSFKLLVQRKLLRQRVAQFGIIVDNENLTRIRHQFRPPQPIAPWSFCLPTSSQ